MREGTMSAEFDPMAFISGFPTFGRPSGYYGKRGYMKHVHPCKLINIPTHQMSRQVRRQFQRNGGIYG
jgi:hypothetical protein